jgi:hypothetical protein
MGRWDERYSEEQRRAVGAYLLDPDPITGKRHTADQAIAALMSGALKVPVPPNPMPRSTAYYCRRREEGRRKGTELSPLARTALEDPDTVRQTIIQAAVSMWDYQRQDLEAQRARGRLDSRLYSLWIKNTPTVLALLRRPTSNGAKAKASAANGRAADPTAPEPQPDELKQLVTAHEQTAKGTAWR